jgi:hypothetical protein
LYSRYFTPRKTLPRAIVATRNTTIHFFFPCDAARTARAIVREERISTAVFKAPRRMSRRFEAPSKAAR